MHSFYQQYQFHCGPNTKMSVCDHGDCVSFGLASAHVEKWDRVEKRDKAGPEYSYEHEYWKIMPGVTIQITKDQIPQVRELLRMLVEHEARNSTPEQVATPEEEEANV